MRTEIRITSATKRQRGEVAFERAVAPANCRRRPADFICRCAARTRWTRFTNAASRRCRNPSRKEKLIRRYHEQFQWPLAAAILLLLAEMFLPERKRRIGRAEQSKVRQSKQSATAALIAVFASANGRQSLAGDRVARLQIGQLHQRAGGILATGGNADERFAPGFQRGRGGVSRHEL